MRNLMAAATLVIAIATAGSAHAQTSVEGRVDRLEREMRAVQRKVFPGGAGQTVEPQITPQLDTTVPGVPASTPLTDLTQRVAALEGQLTSLTGQAEQSEYRLRQLEEAFNAYKAATDARLKAIEDRTAPAAPAEELGTGGPEIAPVDLGEAAAPAAEKPAAKPSGSRAQQLAAIEKPKSGDPAEDGYLYGYRLWSAKLYPEARKALEAVVTKYPEHRRASYAQNLLGRSYLDAGAPSLAAVAFYENFKKNPNGERAPDSLYYLAQSLTKLKKPASEVCKVYDELTQLYGDRLSAGIKAGVAQGRADNKCK
ncbi:tetratricopeptide repeat protein [Sphingomonas sp. DT-207]|uniref:tetratricopeptide repeat protein n=1 Tax=Sphingomonas sp. DT-207 TaxID=3396167 RepID=UPI003F1BF330